MRTFAQKPKATQQTTPVKSAKPSRAFFGQSRDVHPTFHLQRTIGNQAVLRLLQTTKNTDTSSASSASTGFAQDFSRIPVYPGTCNIIQPKLKVGAQKDRYEQEADQVADEVWRQKTPDEEDEKLDIQAKPSLPAAGGERSICEHLENRINRSKGSGSSLPHALQSFFSARMRHDFSDVRVHSDSEAAQMSRELGARAFTYGHDVYFGAGEFSPTEHSGKELLAHELTHVVQNHHLGDAGLVRRCHIESGPGRTVYDRSHPLCRLFIQQYPSFAPGVTPQPINVLIRREGEQYVAYELRIYEPDTSHRIGVVCGVEQEMLARSAFSGAVQGSSIVDILDAAFASRWWRSRRGPLWVMNATDTYTRRVRLWEPVTSQLRVVKQHLEQNCEEWRSAHRTNPSWTPTNPGFPQVDPPPHAWDDPSRDNREAGSWAYNPPGTAPQVCQSAYMEYLTTSNVPDQLWTSAIGSFGLYVTVDSINCESGSAVLNVWMYNNMDQSSFGNPASWFSAAGAAMAWSGGVDPQYMWWNWTEPHHW
jgi:hypothetical protein